MRCKAARGGNKLSKYKLIAVDMDDTLLDSKLRISARAKKVIGKLREQGIYITLSTGRMFRSVQRYAEDLGINLPLITYQGALIKNALTEEVLLHRPVPLELARQVICDIQKYHYHINVYVDDRLCVEKITPEAEQYAAISGVDAIPVGGLLEFLKEPPTKVLAIAAEENIAALERELKAKYAGMLHVTRSKPNFLEFSHPRATKGEALAVLAEKLEVSREQIIAVGDAPNDIEMLEYAGTAVVMGNAREEIKAFADYVAPTNDQDGVAFILEKLVLEEQRH